MSESGRYYVIDQKSGRKFCVEPIQGRADGLDGDWHKGNQEVKGGAVRESESIITPENGFKNIRIVPAGSSPTDAINDLLAE